MPAKKFRLHPGARQDLAEGRDWYAEYSLTTAERFLNEIDRALDLIREAPERWPLFRLGMRRYVLSSFPYSIVYRTTPQSIDVYAVAHAKRRPTYWRKRRFS